ncbi:RHS repeat-associated core domain-containing protein [Kitasatospora kazusensis]
MLATVVGLPAAALADDSSDGTVWVPPNTPLGTGTNAVTGSALDVQPLRAPANPVPQDWTPSNSVALQSGSVSLTLGAASAEAKAAREATGGASPTSSGQALVQAGQLPVALAPADGDTSTRTVKVQVTDPNSAHAAGVDGALVALTSADTSANMGPDNVKVALDLNALQAQSWSDRAHLVALPACALTTPDNADCRKQTPVAATVDVSSGQLTASVTLPEAKSPASAAQLKPSSTVVQSSYTTGAAPASLDTASPMVLAAVAGPSGSAGSYAATSLSPSTAWSAGSNVGNFTYSYPIQVPAVPGGSAPTVALSYDSSAVDGRTSATNAQPSWIGDGWDYQPGFIERSYQSCAKDGITGSGDQCWGGQNATLSLGGHSGTLVRDDTSGLWHLQGDDGSKVEQLTGAPNGLPTGEYWHVTTSDGTQYYFGQNHLPGGDGTDAATNSAWSEPVYSPNSGDPCYSAGSGQGSFCTMGWRWNLDYVVDTHQNLTTYTYGTESNSYSLGGGQNSGSGTPTSYVRAGYLKQINYGQRLPDQIAAHGSLNPAAEIVFATTERCLATDGSCAESKRIAANASSWPDVPLDQVCDGSPGCTNYSPSFFTTKRLTGISTVVFVNSAPVTVDSWALTQSFPNPGDGTKPPLWLSSIVRTGTDGQPSAALPAVSFVPREMANRVDGLVPAAPMFNRPRIQQINTETGGQINVVYSDPQCSRVKKTMPTSEDDDKLACMPVKWYLPGSSSPDPVSDWFNKPLVADVTEQDAVTGLSVVKDTHYTYNGDAAWHRNDSEFADPKTRTWDGFRGYQSVTTTTGSAYVGEAPKTQVTTTYLRGMDGDYKADGTTRAITVPNPLGGADVTDSNWLTGRTLAVQTYDQAGGAVVSMSGTITNGQQTTATHKQSGGMPDLVARYPASQVTATSKSQLSDKSWRTTSTITTTDPANANRIVQTDDQGDRTSATPEICTTTSYAAGSNPAMLADVSETKAVTGPCGTTATAQNTIADHRTLYDGKSFGQLGDQADATSTQTLDHYDTAGNPVYTNVGSATFDVYGRALTSSVTDGSTYDTSGNQLTKPTVAAPATSHTAYLPTTGAVPTTVTTTGPMGDTWKTTVTQDPGRGVPLTTTDQNGRVATQQYDGLGRLTAVWEPGRTPAQDPNPNTKYSYAINGLTSPSVVMTQTLQEGGGAYSSKTELYDGLGRLRQTQSTTPAKPTGRLITDTGYDSHGWAIKTSAPYYEPTTLPSSTIFSPGNDSQIPAQTWTSYDGQGRVVRSEFRSYAQLQWATTTAYPGADRTDVTPPAGGTPTSTVTNARGQNTALWQYHGNTATGNPADADITSYAYTPGGQPAGRTDTAGNTWTYQYDLHGRQTSATDPDTGTSQTFYDVNSRVDHTTDAKGNTLAYTYDLLGRKTGMYTGSVAPANQLASWTFDTLAKGQPTSSTRYAKGTNGTVLSYTEATTGYDTAYRSLGTSVTIPTAPENGTLAGTYITSNTYNPVLGTLATASYPALGGLPAETTGYTYTVTGMLTSAKSAGKPLVADMQYDAMARPVRTTVGGYGTQVVSTQQYDWATGHVINSFIDRQVGTTSADQTSYTYNPAGAITSASDLQNAAATDTQCYTYDYLGRLTNAWTDTGGTATTADWTDSSGTQHGTGSSNTVPGIGGCKNAGGPATVAGKPTVGGPAPYWQSYSYDTTGNRSQLVQHDVNGNAANDTMSTQTFGTAKTLNTPTTAKGTGGGTGGPHGLLTSTATTGTVNKATSYQYDELGNTTAVTDTTGTTNLVWNAEGRLDSVTKTGQPSGTSYLYDADGNQLIRRDPGKTTVNLGADELTLDTSTPNGSMSDVRTLSAPGGLTLTRVTAPVGGGHLLYQAADPHGTTGVQINSDANQSVTRRPTDPFGNPRGAVVPASSWAGDKGFVGGTKDDATGLTNLGAREYQPATGRFLNPDPLLDAGNPQQWNGYAYSDNDPVNASDPNGLMIDRNGGGSDNGPADPTLTQQINCLYAGGCGGTPPATTSSNGSGSGDTTTPHTKKCGGWLSGGGFSCHVGNGVKRTQHVVAQNPIIKTIATAVTYGATFSSCWEAAGLGAMETGGATLVAAGMGCGALAGAASSLVGNLLTEDADHSFTGQLTDMAGGALLGGATGAVGAGAQVAASAASSGGAKAILGAVGDFLGGGSCPHPNSFPAGTLVLLADGSTKAIDQLTTGTAVAATDPQTGTNTPEPVTATIVGHQDQDFTELTLAVTPEPSSPPTDHNSPAQSAKITSTKHHPYWDITTRRWTDATDLHPGDQVRSATATPVTVQAVRNFHTTPQSAYNLTVADLHTYYVLAGATPVLVHNCDLSDRASEIHGAEPDDYVRKNISTVAVVRVRTPQGQVDLIAGSGDGLTPAQMSIPLRPGEMHVPNIPGTHAEQNALLYAKAFGYEPIAGGTSRNVCLSICAPFIRGGGGRMMGNVFPGNGVTTTRQRSFEW